MKSNISNLQHLSGEEAYQLYWQQVYEYRPQLSSIKAVDLNLEIITDSNLKILAYRHDLPSDMQWMVINAGQWQLVGIEKLSPVLLDEVKEIMVRVSSNIFLN